MDEESQRAVEAILSRGKTVTAAQAGQFKAKARTLGEEEILETLEERKKPWKLAVPAEWARTYLKGLEGKAALARMEAALKAYEKGEAHDS